MSQTGLPTSSSSQWDDPWRRFEATASEPAPKPLSKAAVASLVLGVLSASLLGIIFGIVGLAATGRNGERRGRGLAWGGIAASVVWLVVLAGIVVVALQGRAERGLDGSVQQAGTSSYLDLQKGDCLQDPGAATATEVRAVDVLPCTEPHDAQVFAVVQPAPGDYDETRISAEVEDACKTAATSAITVTDPFDLLYFYPQADGWAAGHHNAVCMLSSSSRLTSSVIAP